eukprot:TRINITY_DN769_c0_g2_i2.p1 TRINITY_DN769_c0_g2~~TRINITY_DN769_c0_g2_i2.p1  ORF type:complete len:131 (-),score=29.73 TRINITY_DN769_c0_g2_i2:36-428(-)
MGNNVVREFFTSCRNSNLEKMNFLLSTNPQLPLQFLDSFTALHIASRDGKYEVCKLLIENGADVNVKMRNNQIDFNVSIYFAAQNHRIDVCILLLQNGADIFICQNFIISFSRYCRARLLSIFLTNFETN